MLKFTGKALAALLVSTFLIGGASPLAAADTVTGVITGSVVNLRSAPGGLVVGSVRKGDEVTVGVQSNHYYQVTTSGGTQGYVYEQYIDVNGQTQASASPAALKKGSSGTDVAALQTRLKELGYYTYGTITGYFGSITESALIAFQKNAGFTTTGVADETTLSALNGSAAQEQEQEQEQASAGSAEASETTASEAASPSFNVNQTLTIGSRSDDVSSLQTRLKELGFFTYKNITGYFGSITRDAVMRYQKSVGLSQTGVADSVTLSALFGIEADGTSEPVYVYGKMRTDITLKKGRSGEDVRDMQTALTQKGYYSGPINGSFDSATLYAVMAFQRAMSLTVDGLAGNYTLSALYSLLSLPEEEILPGRLDMGLTLPVELLSWTEASEVFLRSGNATIVDVETGYTFEVCRTGGTRHADVEPLQTIDTATIYKLYGNQWSWERRAIWVIVDGRRLAASMNGMPHGYDTINGNDMRGQFCVHFVGSRTHGSGKVDADHQACIQEAYQAGLDGVIPGSTQS